jgi:hypothetical protein
LVEYRAAIAEASELLDVADPWGAAPPLGRALGALRAALVGLGEDQSPGFGRDVPSELGRSLRERVPLVQEALLRSVGVVMEVRVEDDLLVPGEVVEGVVELWNGGPYPLEGASAKLAFPRAWRVSGELGETKSVPPGALAQWRFRLQVPEGAEPSQDYFLGEPRDGELYRWPRDLGLWAAPANPDILHGTLSFGVGNLGEVEASRPARFRGVDKATGEFLKPVQVIPALSVSMDPKLMAWPSEAEGPREFTVTVLSQAAGLLDGTVSLQIPEGWRAEPEGYPLSLPEAGAEASFSFRVTRPAGLADGRYSVAARVHAGDGREYQNGVSLVDYPRIRRGLLFPPARSEVSVFPVSLVDGIRVGYVMGSGDGGAEAARQMGAEVELLGAEALKTGDFRRFDIVVLGIRAYETRPDLVTANDRLLDFVRGGGTLLVQYNKYEYPAGGFAPFEVGMSRPHDRVSDETARVRILDPAHAIFRFPNLIVSGDFEGWVQELGLYFLGSWGPEFTPLLEMADPGEDPKQGSLMVAQVGNGLYVYTGLAFFRQFSEGVPGAYRLFANLLSLKAGVLE